MGVLKYCNSKQKDGRSPERAGFPLLHHYITPLLIGEGKEQNSTKWSGIIRARISWS
jgi:hypothetical protein